MKYTIGSVVLYKEAELKFEIIEVTPIAYKLLYIDEKDGSTKLVTPELYPHYFIESDEFELSLKTLLKQL